MTDYNEDFVNKEATEKVIEGRKFMIKELTGRESDALYEEYLTITEEGNPNIDIAKRNAAWLRDCVIDAPYEKDGKPFKDLKPEERVGILQTLKVKIRAPLLKAIMEKNDIPKEVKKN